MVTLQHILEMSDFSTQLFAQVNLEQDCPGVWYRQKLFFAPVVQNVPLPRFVKGHLLEDERLVLYNSTIKIRDIFIQNTFEDDVSHDTILVNARNILTSFGMPQRASSGGAVEGHKISDDEYQRMDRCINEVVGPTGVAYADSLRGSPSASMPRIEGNDEQVIDVWSKYVAAAPSSMKLRHIKTTELGTGDCKGVKGEKSCLYLCLSQAAFGDAKYYWRLRMAAAYALYALSFMKPTHPLMDSKKHLFTQVINEIEEIDDDADTDSEDENGNHVHEKKLLRLMRNRVKKIISGTSDAGIMDLNLLCYLLQGIQVCAISASTTDKKPRPRDRNQKRNWRCSLKGCGSGKALFDPIAGAGGEQAYLDAGDKVLIAHVEGQHYVALEFCDSVARTNRSSTDLGEFFIPYETFDADNEEEVMEVSNELRDFLNQEVRGNARTQLYSLYPDERTFDNALEYVKERSTSIVQKELDPFKKRKEKLDALLVSVAGNQKQIANQKYFTAKVKELEHRLNADVSNEEMEASLHMANNTDKIMYDGNKWFAVVKIKSLKREVIVAVEQDWVEQRFHKTFLAFMRTFGRVGGYTKLDEQIIETDPTDPNQVACKVEYVEYRYYFKNEYPTEKFFLKYQKQAAENQEPISVQAEVSEAWLDDQFENHASLSSDFENGKLLCMNGTNNEGNCPCYEKHEARSRNHTLACFRRCVVKTKEDENFVFQLDNRQMHSIMWDESNQKWKGLSKRMQGFVQDEVVDLTDEWVSENFSAEMVESFKERGKKSRIFVKIPPGAPRDDCSIPMALTVPEAPPIAFRQEKGFVCVTNGLASALHYLGHTLLASQLHEFGLSLTSGGFRRSEAIVGQTREFMREKGKAWTPQRVNHSTNLLDEQAYPTNRTPRLVVLESDDGDAGHAVTIVGKWIFDSNFVKCSAPLSRSF